MFIFEEKYLGEIVLFQRGFDITKNEQTHGKIPVISSSGVNSYHNQYRVKGPGVIIGRKGTLGSVYFSKIDFWPHDTTLWIKDFKGNSPNFIYYFLRTLALENFDTGSSNPTLNRNHLYKIKVFFPKDYKTQKKIAAILSTYDDLIENNNKRIELLEKMAEEIYREWFVRFRFPGYQDIKFEKGIPEDWKVSRVASLGNVITGKTPLTSNSKYYGNDFHFIKTPDMHNQTYIFDTEEKLTQLGLESQPSQIIPPDSICVSCIGTGGIVSITTKISSTNQQINSIILKEKSDLEWAFYTLKALKQTILAFGATGSTMTNLSKGKFSNLQIMIPPLTLRKKYHLITLPLFEQIKKLSMLNHQLLSTKNLLLPRLLSGKLSVENLEIAFPPSMQQEKGKVD